MRNDNKLYDWDFLEEYVHRRLQGDVDDALEAIIRQDDFLQTTIEGLEMKLSVNHPTTIQQELNDKKLKLWKKLAVLAPAHPSTSTAEIEVLQKRPHHVDWIQQLNSTWKELQYAQFQYVLGFNFSCMLIILGLCLWANHVQEEVLWLSQVEIPVGFKP